MRRVYHKFFGGYRQLPGIVLQVTLVQFLVEMVNAAFTLILNIHLRKIGYQDDEIAALVAWRYLGILIFAFPLGVFIRTHRIKPFFYFAALVIPLASWVMLNAAASRNIPLAHAAYFIWGSGLMMIQVCVVPFILRNSARDTDSEALSLGYSTFSLGLILSSGIIYGLHAAGRFSMGGIAFPWDEHHILLFISSLCLLAVPVLLRIKEERPQPYVSANNVLSQIRSYDWKLIFRALMPTTLIAIGAGFTIPFMNLFFNSVFGMDSTAFSIMGLFTAVLVVIAALLVPFIRRRFGYGVAITLSQSLAVLLLIGLLLTQPLSHLPGMSVVAIGCYLLRSPLMNMAAPMTNDLIMQYVGPGNREMVSALFSSIWSGSAYLSSKMFQALRAYELDYWKIFSLTAVLYIIGVIAYGFLIRDYNRKMRMPGTERSAA